MADKMPQIVCVGRKYGSGGREIGENLAERLGVPCYDKLLIKKTAAESGLSEDFIRQEEETPAQSRWFLSGNAFADSAALSEAFYSGSQMIYDAEQKVIRQLAEKGPCVIVGRFGAAEGQQRAVGVHLCRRAGLCCPRDAAQPAE